MKSSLSMFSAVVAACLFGVPAATAQVTQPATVNNSSGQLYAAGSTMGDLGGGQTAGFNNALGSPGVAAGGYSNFVYGGMAGTDLFGIEINSAPVQLRLATTVPVGNPGAGTNVAPQNFSNTTAYSFKVVSSAGTTSSTTGPISFFTTDINGDPDVFTLLSDAGQKTAYETTLNTYLKFDQSMFIDPATNLPIDTTNVEGFSFTLGDFITGAGFTSISLNYSPVPEPTMLLAVAVGGVFASRRLRRTA